MKRCWIVGGWGFVLLASALLPLSWVADRIERNHLGKYVDPETGAWTIEVLRAFRYSWLPIAVPVSLLAFACMILNRPSDPR